MRRMEEGNSAISTSTNFATEELEGPDGSCSSNSSVAELADHEQKSEKYHVPFHKMFSFADSTDVLLMIAGSVGALANGAAMPLSTVLFGDMIQSFGGAADNHDVVHRVTKVCIKFVYLAVGSAVASFLQVACWMTTGERQAARIRDLYLKTLLGQEIAFFDKETNAGEVVARMSGDTVLIQDAIGEKVGKFIQLISTFFGGFIVAFVQGWLLAIVMTSLIPLLVAAAAAIAIVASMVASKGQEAYADAAALVEQTIGSIRTVASFTGEKQSVNKYKESLKRAYKSSIHEGLAVGLGLGTIMALLFFGYSLGIWYGTKLILDDKGYTGADIINVIFAILTASFSLGLASPCVTAFAKGQAAAFKIFETVNRKPKISGYDTTGKKLVSGIHGDIELRDIAFSYPSRPDDRVLAGFSLSIGSGTTAALVGESGSGKSTVVGLIERFYDPQAGEVLIDGINLKEFQLKWIRGKIGLVSQEPVLFALSIRENIAYGKEEGATTEEIRAAAELANASKFIDKMPQGLDTMVGEHGSQLSGGQKQRIAIARAILKDPRILLLDEATSALDTESERVVQEALDGIMLNRTTVVVAHRLSTVRNADTIAVIRKGTIVEKGSHAELLKDPNGAYCQLVSLQEMNKSSVHVTMPNLPMKEDSIHLLPPSHLVSRCSSSVGNSSHHSFSVPFGLPVGIEIRDDGSTPGIWAATTAQELKQVSLRRLAKLNKPEIPVLILGSVAAVVSGLVYPIFAVLLTNAMTTFYEPPPALKKDSESLSLIFLLFGTVSFLAVPARSYFFAVAGAKLIERIRLMTFEKVVHMEMGWFDEFENSSGVIGARLSADAAAIRGLVGDALALTVQSATTLIACLAIAFTSSWELALIILALLPALSINGWIQVKFMKGFSADAKMMYGDASQVANEAIGSIRTVASFSAEEKVMELYRKKCEDPMRRGIRLGLTSGVGFGFSSLLLFCAYGTCFYAGGHLVQDGRATFGKVFRVFTALAMAAVGISQSSTLAPDSSKAKSAAASVFSIIDRESKMDPRDDNSMMTMEGLKGEIEFRHVCFRYPTRPNVQIFRDLCLAIPSGKTVALVGESGCGKSTAISLLQRFYDPDSGHILLDGIEIRKFPLRWLRQQMGLVSQEPLLFNDTIEANIAYGKEGQATEAEIVAAAESANAHKFICSLQQGYGTLVGERGVQLSGGQKQRVAIARAIVKGPKILLLDEATSALDAECERVVQDALDRVVVDRTTVVVAHRLSTVRGCDLIAVIRNGVIVEKGDHESLMSIRNGAYASLAAPLVQAPS